MKKWLIILSAIVALFMSTLVQAGAIHEAAERGDTAEVQKLLKRGVHINAIISDGWTALMLAAFNGHTETVQALAQAGADFNLQSIKGKTALDYAKEKNHNDIVTLLTSHMNKGSQEVSPKQAGTQPINYSEQLLSLASTSKHKEIRKLVLMHEADVNYADPKTGEPPLIRALLAKQYETAMLLVLLGSNVNAVSKNKTAPLHIAARQGHLDTVKLLVSNGAKKDARDRNNQTAAEIAKANSHADVATFLEEKQKSLGERKQEQKFAKEIVDF